MKKLFILAGILTALTFTSCKKDKSDPGPGSGNDETQLLKKVTETENGVTTVHTLTYDANKRLVSVISNDNVEKVFFTYDAAGNLTKVDQTEEEFHNIYTYAYTNNVPVSGTFKSWHKEPGMQDQLIEEDLLTYTVANNQVTKLHLEMTMGGGEVDFNFTYNNGNLTKVEASDANLYKAVFTYGTKKSAFPQVTKYILDQAGFSLQFGSKHEILTTSYDFPGNTLDKTITNTYTYNSKGYPATATDGESNLTFEYQ
jgi:YD repeat-containing protein